MQAAYRSNDWQALLALQTAFIAWPGLEELLPRVTVPSLLVAAPSDPFYASAQRCAEVMPNASFISLPAGVHGQDSYTAGAIVPHIRAFMSGVA